MMRLNITESDVPLEELVKILKQGTTLKDVYLLCYQCGCPVYAFRNMEDKIIIGWHPNKDPEKNVIAPHVVDGVLRFECGKDEDVWEAEEELRKSLLASTLLGENPFDVNYCIWEAKKKGN